MKTKMVIVSLLFLSLINGIEHTVVLGSLSLISEEFNVHERIGWFSVLYTLATLITTPLIGYVANDRPLKPLFRIGLFLLIGGFLISFFAPTFVLLLIGRTIAGIGGGFLSILIPTYLGRTFSLEKRVKIDSYNFLAYSSGTFIGPVAGSLIVLLMDWRGIFLLSACLFCLFYLLIEMGLTNENEETMGTENKQDRYFVGQSVFFSLFLLSLILGIELFDEVSHGWVKSVLVFSSLFCLSGFLLFSKKSHVQLFHPSLVQSKLFGILMSFSFVFGVVKFVLTNYLSLYIMKILGMSLWVANMSLTLFLCGNALGNYLVTKCIVRFPYKTLLAFSFFLCQACLLLLIFVSIDSAFLLYIVVVGFGFANGFAGYPNLLILQQKNPKQMGSAAASNTMARHFGGIVGVICFQQFVIQTYGLTSEGFIHGFYLLWGFFSLLGAGIFFLKMEKL